MRAAARVEEHLEAGLVDELLHELPLQRGDNIGLAGLDRRQACDRLGPHGLDDLLDPWAVLAGEVLVADRVVVVADAADLDIGLERGQLERSAGQAVAIEVVVAQRFDLVLRNQRQGGADRVRRGDLGFHRNPRGQVVDHADLTVDRRDDICDPRLIHAALVVCRVASRAVDRELDIFRSQRRAIVPGMAGVHVHQHGREVLDPLVVAHVRHDLARDQVVLQQLVEVQWPIPLERVVARPLDIEAADGVGHRNGHGALPIGVALARRGRCLHGLLLVSLLLGCRLLLVGLLRLLVSGLLLLLLVGLLRRRRLVLLLLLLLRPADRHRLILVIVITTADQRQAGRADPRSTRGAQERSPTHSRTSHSLPVVLLTHSITLSRMESWLPRPTVRSTDCPANPTRSVRGWPSMAISNRIINDAAAARD